MLLVFQYTLRYSRHHAVVSLLDPLETFGKIFIVLSHLWWPFDVGSFGVVAVFDGDTSVLVAVVEAVDGCVADWPWSVLVLQLRQVRFRFWELVAFHRLREELVAHLRGNVGRREVYELIERVSVPAEDFAD